MSNKPDNKMMELKEMIDGLRSGTVKPSAKRLEQARQMARVYNSWKVGEKGLTSRMNDNASVVLAQQLEAIAAETLLQPMEPSIAASILSRAPDVMPGHDTYSYATMTEEGIAKPISNYADDVPMVDLDRNKVSTKIIPYGAGFFWSIDDLEKSVFLGMSLPSEGAMAARRAWERGLDQCLSIGEPDFGITYGLANQPLGTGDTQVNKTTCTSGSWTGTADTTAAGVMYGDLCTLVAEHERDSMGLYPATDLLVPVGALARMRTVRLLNSDLTVLQAFQNANPGVTVRGWTKLGNVDDNSGYNGRMLLLCNRPDVAQAIIAKDFTLYPPQSVNLAFKVVGQGKTGGVAIKTRIGMRYMERLPTE